MNIVLGFGSTETEQREKTFKDIGEILKEIILKNKNDDDEYFSSDMFEKFKKEVKKYTDKIQKKYDEADKSDERPERYYHISFGQRIAYDYDCIFVAIKFWHINSKNPMSPDGMSLSEIKEIKEFYFEDFNK